MTTIWSNITYHKVRLASQTLAQDYCLSQGHTGLLLAETNWEMAAALQGFKKMRIYHGFVGEAYIGGSSNPVQGDIPFSSYLTSDEGEYVSI